MTRSRPVLFLLLALLLPLTTAGPASAEVWRVADETKPQRAFGDIDTVRVDARERFVFVTVTMNGSFPEELALFLDVDGDRRPEFSGRYLGSGRMTIYRNFRWVGRGTADRLRCRPSSTRRDGDVLRVGFSRRCLTFEGRLPTRVRVNVASNYEISSESYDHVPAERRFGRWIAFG